MSNLEFGYISPPTQSSASNTGVFSTDDVYDLITDEKYAKNFQLIEEIVLSGQQYADFTNIHEDKFKVHFMTFHNCTDFQSGGNVAFHFMESGSVVTGSIHDVVGAELKSDGGNYEPKSVSFSYMWIIPASFSGGEVGNGYTYLYNLGNSSLYSSYTMHTTNTDPTTVVTTAFGGGVFKRKSVVNGIRAYFTGGTMNATIRLYGLPE